MENDKNKKVEKVDAEVVEQVQNSAKQPTNTKDLQGDTKESVSEFFEEMIPQNNIINAEDPAEVSKASSFADFDDFDSQEPVVETTDLEVYVDTDDAESDVLLSTGDLAKMFQVSNQTIRNTENFFIEILSDERGADGRKLYTNADIAIIKKIFYMMNVQKYKRRDIRDYLLKNNISAKNGSTTFTVEKNIEGLPVRQQENTGLAKAQLNEALLSLQTNLADKLTEGLSQIQIRLGESISKELQNSAKHIDESLDKTKDELKAVIEEQAKMIAVQKDEIIKLKSTIININHTALEIDKVVKGLGSTGISEDDIKNITASIGDVIKQTNPNSNNSAVVKSVTELKTETQNNAKELKEAIAKQGQTLGNLESVVNKIEKNSSSDRQSTIKSEVADTLNRNYQKIEKALSNTAVSQSKLLDEKLAEIENILRATEKDPSTISEEVVNELNEKLSSALDTIEQLKKENENLELKNTNSSTIISMQKETISSLQDEVKHAQDFQKVPTEENQSDNANSDAEHKLKVAKVLVQRLIDENEDLKKKSEISNLIIKKQDEKIRVFEQKATEAHIPNSNVETPLNEPLKRNTEGLNKNNPSSKDNENLTELLMEE